jgi:hypothetical protein
MTFALPKWPQMRVIGKPIDPEYAWKIIRRTDTFFTSYAGGNNRHWNEWVKNTVGYPKDPKNTDDHREFWTLLDAWSKDWDCVHTEYVHNTWISSSYVYGPYGWCHPDGTIYFEDNVGKWPSSEELIAEWTRIARAFPGLHLDAVFMDGELVEGDAKMVFAVLVRDSEVHVHGPEQYQLYWEAFGRHEYEQPWQPRRGEIDFSTLFERTSEAGVSADRIMQWGAEFRSKHPEWFHA